MKKLLLLLLLTSCAVEEPIATLKEGDVVYLLPNNTKAVIDHAVPGGYVVYVATKLEVKYIEVTLNQIAK